MIALRNQTTFPLYGVDLDTKDGTCVRDFVHVMGVVDAILRCISQIELGGKLTTSINLGSRFGFSVLEVIAKFEEISGVKFAIQSFPKRLEDPLESVAETSVAYSALGWTPKYGLDEMVRSTLMACR